MSFFIEFYIYNINRFCGNAVAEMLQMSSSQKENFLSNFFTDKNVYTDYRIRFVLTFHKEINEMDLSVESEQN